MSRLEQSFKIFSIVGFKFLLIELIIVFLGVYGAFQLQTYSEKRHIKAEKEKILIGLKEDLEYFRVFFPGYAGDDQVEVQRKKIQEEKYNDFSDWRFIQPQYEYTAIEYALNADAEVIEYELNNSLSAIYQELQKLQHVEILMTELAMDYKAIPKEFPNDPLIQFEHQNNFHKYKVFTERMADRAIIMNRIADFSTDLLPTINGGFDKDELLEIELKLIVEYANPSSEEELNQYLPLLLNYFPHITEDKMRSAFKF